MFAWLFEGIGAVSRDIVEGADSTYETAKEVAVETIDEVASIPEMVAKGYAEGFISDGDKIEDPGFNDPAEKEAA